MKHALRNLLLIFYVKNTKYIPLGIKIFYRIIKREKNKSPVIDQSKLVNAKLYHDRVDMIKEIFNGTCIMEVGVAQGKLTRKLLTIKNLKTYITVDVDYSRFKVQDDRIKKYTGLTLNTLHKIKEKPDLIYLDASHKYNDVVQDLDYLEKHLIKGTILVFNDFAIIDDNLGTYGVHKAASEFVNNHNCEVIGLSLSPNALYDLSILMH